MGIFSTLSPYEVLVSRKQDEDALASIAKTTDAFRGPCTECLKEKSKLPPLDRLFLDI